MKSSTKIMRSVRKSAALNIILAALVLGAVAGCQDKAAPPPEATATTTTPSSPVAESAAPAVSAAVEGLTVDQLYREARKAMAEQRMVAPAGNNALEFYLAILAKDPANAGARDALRELFPFASGTAEQEINQGNLEEAARIVDSLAKADPSNYTLTILRSKIDAKKKLQDQQLAQTAAAAAAAAAAAPATVPQAGQNETQAANSTTAAATTEPSTSTSASTAAVKSTPPATQSPAPVQASSAPATPQGETRDVEVVTPVAPSYPPKAARNREEGWVEVEFTVTASGNVENASVTKSNPPRTFDREAVRSIERTKFKPRLENGVPVDTTVRRRIEFKLGG